ncbi:BTB/POZ domain-containing protein [Glomus cerebriforme]|uniref:BTB/POZ domain-containing protein n=1 Tax=Glomus cerebriforme TaxID=658196 RepID=A0A397THZ4_9GLOM|nr:BTB/POZ domain-containing protein [Glomus cerebriforme]
MVIYQENITADYQQHFEDDYNVIIYAGEEPNIKEIHAHSIILRYRSQYFRAAFSPNWAKKENGTYILEKPNISGTIFQIILGYIYKGKVDFSQIERTQYIELLKAADELGFDKIVENLQKYLIENQNEYLNKDPMGLLKLILPYEEFKLLKNYCLNIMCQEAEKFFENERLLITSPQILELLLQQDNLALEEIDIWKYLIKYAHAQNPNIELEPSKWTKDDIEIMKQSIGSYIPLIRFQNISTKDYFDKINPYEKLLKLVSKNIWKFYSVSNVGLDSSIITPHQRDHLYSLFVNWISQNDKIYKTRKFIQYEFKLILRGSRDGFIGDSFHYRCDNKGATIIIAKIKNSNKLVGGYNPLDWEGRGSKSTSDSFIFLFENYKNINSGKISRVIDTKRAVRCFRRWGPIFGAYNTTMKSNDLAMNSNGEWVSISSSYPNLNIPNKFNVDDYEVFQVVKRKY